MASDSFIVQYDSTNKREEPPPQRQQIRLTPEEIRILKDCNRESFYYRCLPLALTAMAATHIGVKKGFLKGHPKYGSIIKQIGAGFMGWIVGKFSYRSICEEKFIHLPNSSLGDAIRKKRGYSVSDTLTLRQWKCIKMFQKENIPKSDDSSSFGSDDSSFQSDSDFHNSSYGALNLDTDKNIQAPGFDDRERPTLDSFGDTTSEDQPPRPSVSYGELRQRNREEYERQFRISTATTQQSSNTSLSSRMWDQPSRRTEFQSDNISRRNPYQNEDKSSGMSDQPSRRTEFQSDNISRRNPYQTEKLPSQSRQGEWEK